MEQSNPKLPDFIWNGGIDPISIYFGLAYARIWWASILADTGSDPTTRQSKPTIRHSLLSYYSSVISQSITEPIKKLTIIIYCSPHFTYVISWASHRNIFAYNAQKSGAKTKNLRKETRKFILWGEKIIASDKNIRLDFDCSIVRVPFEWIALAHTHSFTQRSPHSILTQ